MKNKLLALGAKPKEKLCTFPPYVCQVDAPVRHTGVESIGRVQIPILGGLPAADVVIHMPSTVQWRVAALLCHICPALPDYRHHKGANYVAFDGSAHHGTKGKLDNQAEAWQSGL